MIKSKNDLKVYLFEDMGFYHELEKKDRIICALTNDPLFEIMLYLKMLRKEEYFFNCRKDFLGRVCYLWYFRRKNRIGNRLGFKIPKNTFGPGLTIYHNGEIIVNETARIGANARLHGGNCIGNNGKEDIAPIIGDNLDMGIGSKIIGPIVLGDRVRTGANAVVTHSFCDSDITLVGIPAKRIDG